jgi:hypothetical protein
VTVKHQALSLMEKAEASPSSLLHTTFEGPTEGVCEMQNGCKVYMHLFLRGVEWTMIHGHLDCFQKPPLEGRRMTKPGDRV